jgi:hypothetical protein
MLSSQSMQASRRVLLWVIAVDERQAEGNSGREADMDPAPLKPRLASRLG